MIESILVGTDGSPTAAVAVAHAVELARALTARLQIVSAYEPVPGQRPRGANLTVTSDEEWTVNPREDVLALLASAAAGAVAEEQRSNLIVVGHKGMTGATRFLLGSVPNKVSHHAPCSVLIVRTG
jgi:nucleotide-binding universal stress UspA family protein